MLENNQLDIADISEFQRVLFQMNPQQITKVVAAVDAMKPELQKRIAIRDSLEQFAIQHGCSLKSLQLTKSTIRLA